MSGRLESLRLTVPEHAAAAYEAALAAHCPSVARFVSGPGEVEIEGVRSAGGDGTGLALALALAAAASGVAVLPEHRPIPEGGWLARVRASFPEQRVGARFAIRGSHLSGRAPAGRIALILDAGMAFGSGEHGSTRGCLLALERLARPRPRPRRILDLGTGSGVLALAAARLWHRPVLAADNDPHAVRAARRNAVANGLGTRVRVIRADGWRSRAIGGSAPYDLVLANILARPLVAMAASLARNLAPGGRAVLAGLLARQAALVLTAHRRVGLVLEGRVAIDGWITLILRRPTCP
ncbi:MAG TPA: 50S ribosomal protein L11 methyltransferase [Acetobacteraceae bacterium]|nr:50S ribosomal protein L11 methyltransferase [Acetobacteraceae bacterium]